MVTYANSRGSIHTPRRYENAFAFFLVLLFSLELKERRKDAIILRTEQCLFTDGLMYSRNNTAVEKIQFSKKVNDIFCVIIRRDGIIPSDKMEIGPCYLETSTLVVRVRFVLRESNSATVKTSSLKALSSTTTVGLSVNKAIEGFSSSS